MAKDLASGSVEQIKEWLSRKIYDKNNTTLDSIISSSSLSATPAVPDYMRALFVETLKEHEAATSAKMDFDWEPNNHLLQVTHNPVRIRLIVWN